MDELVLVRIHWRDASHRQGWYSSSEVTGFASSDYVIESVGWLADENDSHLAIAQSRSLHRFGDVLIIPKTTVVERWDLNDG